jgi:DNA-binding response OmpR family regulator
MAAKKPTALIAEDDPQLARFIRRSLELEGYRVLIAQDGLTALDLAATEELALILVDIGLPGMDGLTLCARIREFSNVPIIIITARREEDDQIRGLETGADDYLPKPFGVDHLLARIKAVQRRARAPEGKPRSTYCYDDLQVDFAAQQVRFRGEEVLLTRTERQLLFELASYPGQVLTQQQLLRDVWGENYSDADGRHLIHSNINRLRKRIEPDPVQPHYILTRAGLGYLVPKPNC